MLAFRSDGRQASRLQLPAWETISKSGPGTADLTKFGVLTPDSSGMPVASPARSNSESPEATSLNIASDGSVYMIVASEKGVPIRFEASAFQFAISKGLFDYAKSFADIIQSCLGKQPAMGCRLYRDPEIGECCLVFDATIADDPKLAVRQLEDFRRQAADALPAASRHLLRLFYHVS